MIATRIKPKRSSHYIFDVTGGHLADYLKHVESKGLSKNHMKVTSSNCANLISGENWAYISDITTKSVNDYISKARDSGVKCKENQFKYSLFERFLYVDGTAGVYG